MKRYCAVTLFGVPRTASKPSDLFFSALVLRPAGTHPEISMTRDQELWACALAVERQHGGAAIRHAAFKVDRFEAAGEHVAAAVWREVLKRLAILERAEAALQ